jgi:hypothetical protein
VQRAYQIRRTKGRRGSSGAIRVIATLRLRGSARRAWKPDPSRTVMSREHSNEIGTGGCLIHAFVQDAPPSVLFVQRASRFQGCFTESTRRAIREGQETHLHFGYYTTCLHTSLQQTNNLALPWGHGKKLAMAPKAMNVQCRAALRYWRSQQRLVHNLLVHNFDSQVSLVY